MVRLLQHHKEFQECVRIQEEVWGDAFAGTVPASLLQAGQKVGAIVGGAFCRESSVLQGFVFGLSGPRNGQVTHWSHMLAVLPKFRGRGIGQRLKRAQRGWALRQGIREMRWTFDPLVAGNAKFNMNLIGVSIESYEPDMYGDTASDLHAFGTDRVIACWNLRRDPEGVEAPVVSDTDASDFPYVNVSSKGIPSIQEGIIGAQTARVRIGIPSDIVGLHRVDPEGALRWRHATRAAFLECLQAGFVVGGFAAGGETRLPFYLLRRNASNLK